MNLMEEIQLLRRVEKLEAAAMANGWKQYPAPPIPEKLAEEVVPCTITDRPVLVSPFGKPRYTQAGIQIEHDGVTQQHRVDFIGHGRYHVICQVPTCKKKLAVDITLGALNEAASA